MVGTTAGIKATHDDVPPAPTVGRNLAKAPARLATAILGQGAEGEAQAVGYDGLNDADECHFQS